MNYATLEEAYGSPFGVRKTVEETTSRDAPAKPAFTSLAKKAEASREKNQGLVNDLLSSLPLARETTPPPMQQERQSVRENFRGSQPAGVYATGQVTPHEEADKVSRILRLVEQNRTGYERPALQDIGLYIFTGVFFLFTFDTFVEIGKTMARAQRT